MKSRLGMIAVCILLSGCNHDAEQKQPQRSNIHAQRIDPITPAKWAVIREQFLTNGYMIHFPQSVVCNSMTFSNALHSLALNMKDAKADVGMTTLADTVSYIWYRNDLFYSIRINFRASTNWIQISNKQSEITEEDDDVRVLPGDDPHVTVEIYHSPRPIP